MRGSPGPMFRECRVFGGLVAVAVIDAHDGGVVGLVSRRHDGLRDARRPVDGVERQMNSDQH